MAYKIVLMKDAEEDLDRFINKNPFVCHRRKPTTFRWWEEPCKSFVITPDSQYIFVW